MTEPENKKLPIDKGSIQKEIEWLEDSIWKTESEYDEKIHDLYEKLNYVSPASVFVSIFSSSAGDSINDKRTSDISAEIESLERRKLLACKDRRAKIQLLNSLLS